MCLEQEQREHRLISKNTNPENLKKKKTKRKKKPSNVFLQRVMSSFNPVMFFTCFFREREQCLPSTRTASMVRRRIVISLTTKMNKASPPPAKTMLPIRGISS